MAANKKSEAMKKKTQVFHSLFNMPESETVIQACPRADLLLTTQITAAFVGISPEVECISHKTLFASHPRFPIGWNIDDIHEESGMLWSGIAIVMADKSKFVFSGFVGSHRTEALHLLQYLHNNPPSYHSVQDESEEPLTVFNRSNTTQVKMQSSNPSITSLPVTETSTSYGSQQQQQLRVDVQTSKNALRLIQETVQISTDTLQEVQRQAEQIDRIERSVENIHANLDKSDRILRGMESLPAYFGNKWSKKGKQPPPTVVLPDRTITVTKGEQPIDIEILCKNADDSFTPALLRLFSDWFTCIDINSGKPLQPEYVWSYNDVESVVMRSRPEHADIRFKPPRNRFRLMSSYLQAMTNELVLRTPRKQIQVIFEEGSRKFEYGNPKLSSAPVASRKFQSFGFVRKEAIKPISSLLSESADPQLRADLDETDRDLDAISDMLSVLNDQQVALGQEVVRQTEQLDRINARVDEAMPRIEKQNRRMENLMK